MLVGVGEGRGSYLPRYYTGDEFSQQGFESPRFLPYHPIETILTSGSSHILSGRDLEFLRKWVVTYTLDLTTLVRRHLQN